MINMFMSLLAKIGVCMHARHLMVGEWHLIGCREGHVCLTYASRLFNNLWQRELVIQNVHIGFNH